jgi:hypothetical protein
MSSSGSVQGVAPLQTSGTLPLDLSASYKIPQIAAKSGSKGARSHIPPLDLAVVWGVAPLQPPNL